ncbi:MAG: winged helix-turn-helix domain-containing protein [archaeon]
MNTRRNKLDIVNDMLTSINEKGGKIKPTHLMYKANLSHKLLSQYLEDLVSNELVKEVSEGSNKYLILTSKGVDFLNQFRKMREFQKSFGL